MQSRGFGQRPGRMHWFDHTSLKPTRNTCRCLKVSDGITAKGKPKVKARKNQDPSGPGLEAFTLRSSAVERKFSRPRGRRRARPRVFGGVMGRKAGRWVAGSGSKH